MQIKYDLDKVGIGSRLQEERISVRWKTELRLHPFRTL